MYLTLSLTDIYGRSSPDFTGNTASNEYVLTPNSQYRQQVSAAQGALAEHHQHLSPYSAMRIFPNALQRLAKQKEKEAIEDELTAKNLLNISPGMEYSNQLNSIRDYLVKNYIIAFRRTS